MAQDAVIRLLLVEDQLEDAEQLISMLRNGGMAIRPQRPENSEELDNLLANQPIDIVLGNASSSYLKFADVAKRVILVVLFDQRATLGLVKLKAKGAVEQLTRVFEDMFNRVGTGPQQPGILEGAEDEIDKLFG